MSTTRRRKGAPEPDLRVVYAEVSLRATARDYAAACDLCDDESEAHAEGAWRDLRDAALAYAKLVQR